MMTIMRLALAILAATTFVYGAPPEIFLPPDAEVVTIVGNGFSLQVNQMNMIKDQWKDVATSAAQVEAPRDDNNNVVTNSNLYEKTIEGNGGANKDYGLIDEDLLDWITTRATALASKVERFEGEVTGLQNEERLVVQILLLNTLTDLENLVKENIKPLKWIKKKVRNMSSLKEGHLKDVAEWIQSKIQDNLAIEKKIKSTNKPTPKWLTNVSQIKRVLHEQRFSEEISKMIIGHLGGTFSMMERSTVFDINRTKKDLNAVGLYYIRAKNRVPAHFPFSAQDAIVNEA